MTGATTKMLGALIQEYASARWGPTPDRQAAERIGKRLDRAVRDRVDMLGLDAERLLTVDRDRVESELERLEAEAVAEDTGARPAAIRARSSELDGGGGARLTWRSGARQQGPGHRTGPRRNRPGGG